MEHVVQRLPWRWLERIAGVVPWESVRLAGCRPASRGVLRSPSRIACAASSTRYREAAEAEELR
jgi:hypothetical protein